MNSEINKDSPQETKIRAFMKILENQGAVAPEVLPLPPEFGFIDTMIVAGATSKRHAQGMADALDRLCHELKQPVLGMEGYNEGNWILLDCNDIVVHILSEDSRKLYRLEELWAHTALHKEHV